jgi:hypothetical protein
MRRGLMHQSSSLRRKKLTRQTSTTTFQKTAKGKLKVQQCDKDGRYVMVENTGTIVVGEGRGK